MTSRTIETLRKMVHEEATSGRVSRNPPLGLVFSANIVCFVFFIVFCCSVCFFIVFSSCYRGWLCNISVILAYPLYLCSGVFLL